MVTGFMRLNPGPILARRPAVPVEARGQGKSVPVMSVMTDNEYAAIALKMVHAAAYTRWSRLAVVARCSQGCRSDCIEAHWGGGVKGVTSGRGGAAGGASAGGVTKHWGGGVRAETTSTPQHTSFKA